MVTEQADGDRTPRLAHHDRYTPRPAQQFPAGARTPGPEANRFSA
jgi:hypothetical protein